MKEVIVAKAVPSDAIKIGKIAWQVARTHFQQKTAENLYKSVGYQEKKRYLYKFV